MSAVVFDQDAVMDQLLGSAVFELKGLNASNKGARFLTPDEVSSPPRSTCWSFVLRQCVMPFVGGDMVT